MTGPPPPPIVESEDEYREKIKKFYAAKNPEKLGDVDFLIIILLILLQYHHFIANLRKCPLCREVHSELTTVEELVDDAVLAFMQKSYSECFRNN